MKKFQRHMLAIASFSSIIVTISGVGAQTITQPTETSAVTPSVVAPSAAPAEAAPTVATSGCAMEVNTAPSVAGVTTKSGLMKFALGTVLPSIAGSVAGSGGGTDGFKAGRDLATQSSIATNRAMADKTSDVPQLIAEEYARERQANKVNAILASKPIKELNGTQCQRTLAITGITFEHSKDYKSRNAIVIQSSLAEYRAGIGKPFIRVFDETRTELKASPLADEAGAPALQSELNNALNASVSNLLDRFAKKQK